MPTYFCPRCFAKLAPSVDCCPFCLTDIADYLHSTAYVERLIHALNHPESETRMAAVIGLGRLAAPEAVSPLLALLKRWPADVVQGGEAIQSLQRIGTDAAKNGLKAVVATHPSQVIRHLAERAPNATLDADTDQPTQSSGTA